MPINHPDSISKTKDAVRVLLFLAAVLLVSIPSTAYSQPGDSGGGRKYNISGGKGFWEGGRMKQEIFDRLAIEDLLDESEKEGEAEVGPSGKTITKLMGSFKIDQGKPAEEAVLDFIDRHKDAFGLKNPKDELKLSSKDTDKWSLNIVYHQMYKGIHIYWRWLSAHIDNDGKLYLITSTTIPTIDTDIDTTPLISKEEAVGIARADIKRSGADSQYHPRIDLFIYEVERKAGNDSEYHLTYSVVLFPYSYLIDADTGEILHVEKKIPVE